ncbi:hypothetical protein H5410_013420 [Solanum commersonii]|uniref:Uncharacterized protein n=1 Tax=Solanum commersonii TaxID=4109 RepID=A0A9J6AVD2_SOLCO|nr:hypothetical protein H5410_013420 [Solanum commersonii]
MKIRERVVEMRGEKRVSISENRFGFMPGRSTQSHSSYAKTGDKRHVRWSQDFGLGRSEETLTFPVEMGRIVDPF